MVLSVTQNGYILRVPLSKIAGKSTATTPLSAKGDFRWILALRARMTKAGARMTGFLSFLAERTISLSYDNVVLGERYLLPIVPTPPKTGNDVIAG
jgi:hypothetical protein